MKSTNYLLFKQIFKNIFREKLQYFLLVFLVIVATALASGLWITNTRLTNEAKQMNVAATRYDYFSNYLVNGVNVNQLSYFSRGYGEASIDSSTNKYQPIKDSAPVWFASRSNPSLSTIDPRLLVESSSPTVKSAGIFVSSNGVSFTNWTNFTLGSWQVNDYFNPAKNLYFLNMANPDVKHSTYGKLITNYEQTKDVSYLNTAWNLLCEITNTIQSSPTAQSKLFELAVASFKETNPGVACTYKNFFTNWLDKNVKSKSKLTLSVASDTKIDSILTPKTPNGVLFGAPMIFKSSISLYYGVSNSGYFNPFNFSFNRNNNSDATKITFNSDQESHLELLIQAAGMGAGFDTHFRRSFTFQDYAAQLLYSFVDIGTQGVTNNNLNTFSVFEGSSPKSKYQVVISPQYARYVGKGVGDKIVVNKKTLTISGIGGDGYYIYPVINTSSVLPNTRHEVLVYGLNSLYNDDQVVTYSLNERTLFDGVYFHYDNRLNSNVESSGINLDNLMILNTAKSENNSIGYSEAFKNPSKYSRIIKIQKFSDLSQAQQSRTTWFIGLQKMFNLIAIIVTVIIIIIAALAGVAITKFLVNKASSQFGVLKANGYGSVRLTMSYIALPLAICVIGVPIGWIIGMVLQTPFTEIFNTMFMLPHNLFSISGIPLVVLFFGFLGLLGITVFLTAFFLLKKETLTLLTSSFKLKISKTILRLQNSIRVKNFTFQFQMSLVATNFRKLIILSGAFFVSSLVISLSFLIPGSISSLGTNYYKNLDASVTYNYNGVAGNSPFSRLQLYQWNGLYGSADSTSPFDNDSYPINTIFPVSPYIKYDNVMYSFSDIADGKQMPQVAMKSILTSIIAQFAWSFDSLQAKTISPGFLNAVVNLLPDVGIASKTFQTLVCNVLGNIVGQGQVTGNTIQQCMSSLIYNYNGIPIMVRQLYNSSPQIQKEFRLTWNTMPFNAKTDELYTWFNSLMLDNDNKPILDADGKTNKSIKSYGVNLHSKFLKLSQNQRNSLSPDWDHLQTVDRTINGKTEKYKVVPVLVNNSLEKQENYKIGQYLNFYPTHNELQWEDNKDVYHPLLKNPWSYDNNVKTDHSTDDVFSLANLNQIINIPYKELANKQGIEFYRNPTQEIYHPDLFRFDWNKQLQENGIKKLASDDPNAWWINHFYNYNSYCGPGSTPTSCASSSGGKRFDSNYVKYTTHPFSSSFGRGLTTKSGIQPRMNGKSWAETEDPGLTTASSKYLTSKSGSTWGTSDNSDGARHMWENVNVNGDDPHNGRFSQDYLNKLIDGEKNYAPGSKEWTNAKCSVESTNSLCSDPYSIGYGSKVIYKVVGVHASYNDPALYMNQDIANHLVHFDTTKSSSVYNSTNNYKSDPFNNNDIWFNGKFSDEKDPSDLISTYSTSMKDNSMFYEIGAISIEPTLNPNNVQLLGIQHAVFDKFSEIALALITIIVIIVIIASAICVVMITNIFITQFSKIIAVMKIQGYSRAKVNWMMLSIFSPGVLIAFGVSFYLAWEVFKSVSIKLFAAVGFNVPITFIPWVLPVCILVILGIYGLSFLTGIMIQKRMNILEIASSSDA